MSAEPGKEQGRGNPDLEDGEIEDSPASVKAGGPHQQWRDPKEHYPDYPDGARRNLERELNDSLFNPGGSKGFAPSPIARSTTFGQLPYGNVSKAGQNMIGYAIQHQKSKFEGDRISEIEELRNEYDRLQRDIAHLRVVKQNQTDATERLAQEALEIEDQIQTSRNALEAQAEQEAVDFNETTKQDTVAIERMKEDYSQTLQALQNANDELDRLANETDSYAESYRQTKMKYDDINSQYGSKYHDMKELEKNCASKQQKLDEQRKSLEQKVGQLQREANQLTGKLQKNSQNYPNDSSDGKSGGGGTDNTDPSTSRDRTSHTNGADGRSGDGSGSARVNFQDASSTGKVNSAPGGRLQGGSASSGDGGWPPQYPLGGPNGHFAQFGWTSGQDRSGRGSRDGGGPRQHGSNPPDLSLIHI